MDKASHILLLFGRAKPRVVPWEAVQGRLLVGHLVKCTDEDGTVSRGKYLCSGPKADLEREAAQIIQKEIKEEKEKEEEEMKKNERREERKRRQERLEEEKRVKERGLEKEREEEVEEEEVEQKGGEKKKEKEKKQRKKVTSACFPRIFYFLEG